MKDNHPHRISISEFTPGDTDIFAVGAMATHFANLHLPHLPHSQINRGRDTSLFRLLAFLWRPLASITSANINLPYLLVPCYYPLALRYTCPLLMLRIAVITWSGNGLESGGGQDGRICERQILRIGFGAWSTVRGVDYRAVELRVKISISGRKLDGIMVS